MLSDDEQRELLDNTRALRLALMSKKRSRSIYADPDEGARWPWYELLENVDGHTHERDVEAGARQGNKDDIFRVFRQAVGDGASPKDVDIQQAKDVLVDVKLNYPEILEEVEREYQS